VPRALQTREHIHLRALWALEKPEVSIRNFVADPQRPQANKERSKGKKISNCNIKKGHTAYFQKKKEYSNTLITIRTKAGTLVARKVPF
jgi:hypothetical protein